MQCLAIRNARARWKSSRSIDGLMKAERLMIQGFSATRALANRRTGLVIKRLRQNANSENETDPNKPTNTMVMVASCNLSSETKK